MDETQTCNRKHASLAVVRKYAPARIEHELLARVLELIGPGSANEQMQAADMFNPSAAAALTVGSGESTEHQYQTSAPEPAA